MKIRTARMNDLDNIAAVEAVCFPRAEAASRQQLAERLAQYPAHFWLMLDGSRVIAFIDGMASDERDLTDAMYAKAAMHNEKGAWQMLFGVNTIPEYRRRGYAGQLLRQVIADARSQRRKGLVLTCKQKLAPYYARFGFCEEGVSASQHGGAQWHQMRLTFDETKESAHE